MSPPLPGSGADEHFARADEVVLRLELAQRRLDEILARELSVLGAGRGGQSLWRWLGRSMFAPTRIAVRPGA